MKNTKISTVLNEIEGMNEDRVIDFLQNKYSDKPLLIKSILDILSINNSKANYFVYASLIKNHSLDLIKDFNPNEYINIVCGDWVIDSLICVTKKSAVFKASPADKSYDHKAAIKVLLPTFEFIASNNTSMQAHYISNLKHPNIVEGYGKGELKNGMSYVVMELLSNENIVEFCKSKKLKRDEICNLFLELCSGVSHMHISGCVHSDFNPNNVFMDVTGKPKIIDFDLSLTTNSAFHNNHSFNHVNISRRKHID